MPSMAVILDPIADPNTMKYRVVEIIGDIKLPMIVRKNRDIS
tara:strand:- start:556 stop:681 length:126 start_codon:yes stop_codon:yes gene_type:complete